MIFFRNSDGSLILPGISHFNCDFVTSQYLMVFVKARKLARKSLALNAEMLAKLKESRDE